MDCRQSLKTPVGKTVSNAAETIRRSIFMTVDFFDEISLHGDAMRPNDVRVLVSKCKSAGVDGILWRTAGLGVAGYPSKRLSNLEWLHSADRSVLFERAEGSIPQGERYNPDTPLAKTLGIMDPVAEAVAACNDMGLDIYLWVDVFDEQNGRFLIEHPDCQIMSSAGKYWPGVRDYSNHVAVEAKIDDIRELLAYSPNGLYLSTSCHSRHLPFPEADYDFGVLPADTYTGFLRRLGEVACGIKIMVGTPFGATMDFCAPYMSDHVKYQVEIDWRRWIDENLADTLVLGDYEWTWDGVANWHAKGLDMVSCVPGHEPADIFGPEYATYSKGRVNLVFFSSWLSAYAQHHHGASSRNLVDAMRLRAETVERTGIDGLLLHEAHTFEYYDAFNLVGELRHRWNQ